MFATLVALVGAAGCPGSLDDPDRFVEGGAGSTGCPSGYDVEKDLFQASCASSSCHDGNNPAGSLDLSSNAFAAMLDQGSSDTACGSRKLIDSADPAKSFLLEKLTSASPACGDRMPFGGAALGADKVACVKSWIDSKLGLGGSGGSGGADASSGGSGGSAGAAGSAGAGGSAGASDAGAD